MKQVPLPIMKKVNSTISEDLEATIWGGEENVPLILQRQNKTKEVKPKFRSMDELHAHVNGYE